MVEEGVVKPWYGGDVETPQVGVGVAPESANLLRRYSAVIDVIIANEKTVEVMDCQDLVEEITRNNVDACVGCESELE